MMYTRRAIIVVPASGRETANEHARTVDQAGDGDTFTVGLVSAVDSNGQVTHYWCSWRLTQDQWDALQALFGAGNTNGYRMFDGDIQEPDEILIELGLTMPPALSE